MDLILERFPDGFEVEDLKTLHDMSGKLIRCLEIKTDEVDYLFKMDVNMIELLDDHSDDDIDMPDMDDGFDTDGVEGDDDDD